MSVVVKLVGEPQVSITMDHETAVTLATVLGSVGGSPKGPRGRVDLIRLGLEAQGIVGLPHLVSGAVWYA